MPRDYMSEKVVPGDTLRLLGGDPNQPVRVVAVEGWNDDWAAYAHYAQHQVEYVISKGHKLFVDDAARIFPFLNPVAYRH